MYIEYTYTDVFDTSEGPVPIFLKGITKTYFVNLDYYLETNHNSRENLLEDVVLDIIRFVLRETNCKVNRTNRENELVIEATVNWKDENITQPRYHAILILDHTTDDYEKVMTNDSLLTMLIYLLENPNNETIYRHLRELKHNAVDVKNLEFIRKEL